MVKQDAVDSEHAIGLPVFLGDPVAVLLGNGVGGIGVEGGSLPLGDLLHFAEQLRSGGLIDLGLFRQPQNPAGFQNPQHTQSVHVTGILRHIEGHLHMGLGRQIVNFVRLHQRDDADQAGRIGQIAVVKLDFVQNVVDAGGVGEGCPAGNAMDLIALFQQKFGKIGAVLTGDAGDQCFFHKSS